MSTNEKKRKYFGAQYQKYANNKVKGYSKLEKYCILKTAEQKRQLYNPHSKWAAAKYNMIVYGMKPKLLSILYINY